MGEVNRLGLEAELARHYASQREETCAKTLNELVCAMVAEDANASRARPRSMGAVEFVASQVLYIPAWTWVAQVSLVVLMCVLAHVVGDADSTRISMGILSAACVLVGVPTMHASKLYRVAELEYACPYNAASVTVARLIVLGCSSALAVAIMVGATASAAEASTFCVAVWACPPFFLSCAGSLMALRKAHPCTATMLCVAWAAACSVALLVLASVFPDLYGETSLVVWVSAAGAALAWLACEVVLTLREATAGLDAFSPQLARTHN